MGKPAAAPVVSVADRVWETGGTKGQPNALVGPDGVNRGHRAHVRGRDTRVRDSMPAGWRSSASPRRTANRNRGPSSTSSGPRSAPSWRSWNSPPRAGDPAHPVGSAVCHRCLPPGVRNPPLNLCHGARETGGVRDFSPRCHAFESLIISCQEYRERDQLLGLPQIPASRPPEPTGRRSRLAMTRRSRGIPGLGSTRSHKSEYEFGSCAMFRRRCGGPSSCHRPSGGSCAAASRCRNSMWRNWCTAPTCRSTPRSRASARKAMRSYGSRGRRAR